MTTLQQVLKAASELDVDLVGIRMSHPLLEGSERFPWPSSSLFANGRYVEKVAGGIEFDRGCAAWELARRAGIYGGCGNSMQASIKHKVDIPPGVWQLQADGWVQIA
jgi:hypothetical protein